MAGAAGITAMPISADRNAKLELVRSELSAVIGQLKTRRDIQCTEVEGAIKHLEAALAEVNRALVAAEH